jgi:hypothetical protein
MTQETLVRALAYGFTIAAVVLFARTIVVAMRVRRFVRDAVHATGTVIDYTECTEKRTVSDSSRESGMATETVAVYRLRIKFTTAEGARVDASRGSRPTSARCSR